MNAAANQSIPEVLSPPLSPPDLNRGPQRSIAKTSALKLITTFGEQGSKKAKFFAETDDSQTPLAAHTTPIAESAVDDVTTAFIRPSNRSGFNTPSSARSNVAGFGRKRLPSIGEMPSDYPPDLRKQPPMPTSHARMTSEDQEALAVGLALQRAATASPMMMREYKKAVARAREAEQPPSPDAKVGAKLEHTNAQRNGPRDRIPKGVDLHLQPFGGVRNDAPPSESSVTSSTKFHWPSRRRGPGSVSSVTSASTTGRSYRGTGAGSSRGDIIHSLDAAQPGKKGSTRHTSREGRKSSRSRSRHRKASSRERERSGERGRSDSRGWPPAKRSPTSPVPMSPEDLINLSTPRTLGGRIPEETPSTVRKRSKSRGPPISRPSSRASAGRRGSSHPRPAPLDLPSRGRTETRDRSPTSPIPMSATGMHYEGSEDEEDFRKALEEQERFRTRHNRSTSTVTPRTSYTATKRDRSGSRSGSALNSPELNREVPAVIKLAPPPKDHAGDLRAMKDERQRKKEQAARDLEERRKSLAQRPLAPLIPHPSHLSPGLPQVVEAPAALQTDSGPRTHSGELRSMYARSNPHVGLPATPKAMRLVLDSDTAGLPDVPPIPATFAQRNSPNASPSHSPAKAREQEKAKEAQPTLTLLPSTVYQPPSRPMIPRSMSAPPEKQAMFHRSSDTSRQPPMPTLTARAHSRASSMTKGAAGDLQGFEETGRRSSHDNMPPPPPPPPAPPALKELQHLALPPPPPPAPLPHLANSKGGALASGMIEIVVDEDEKPVPEPVTLSSQAYSQNHSRGRSFTDREKDNSISGRFSKATERFRGRSASRNRGAQDNSRIRSPPADGYSPYESIQPPNSYEYQLMRAAPYESVRDPNTPGMSTGLHESELI